MTRSSRRGELACCVGRLLQPEIVRPCLIEPIGDEGEDPPEGQTMSARSLRGMVGVLWECVTYISSSLGLPWSRQTLQHSRRIK